MWTIYNQDEAQVLIIAPPLGECLLSNRIALRKIYNPISKWFVIVHQYFTNNTVDLKNSILVLTIINSNLPLRTYLHKSIVTVLNVVWNI